MANYTNITNPMDFHEIFVNSFAGSIQIFFFIAIMFFAYAAARIKMPNIVFLILLSLFVVMMGAYYPSLLTIFIAVAGLIGYWIMSRMIKT